MEVASIKGDTVLLLYHPAEDVATVGQQFLILELPQKCEGLVVQVISNDSLDYVGLQQEMIQRILEQRLVARDPQIDRELGIDELKSLKLATAKIRKRVQEGEWRNWDGWIPTRNVEILQVEVDHLLQQLLPVPEHPLQSLASFNGQPIEFEGSALNMVNVVTGVKGSGKSHLAKLLMLELSAKGVPCIVYDLNGEYLELPNATVLSWRQNFLPELAEVGYIMLETVVRMLYPLQPGTPSASIFETRLPNIFNERREALERRGTKFQIDIAYLRNQHWGGGDYVEGAIDRRLEMIQRLRLFAPSDGKGNYLTSIEDAYDAACAGEPIVFDMRRLSANLQEALVRSVNRSIEQICARESDQRTGRYPFVFFEEAHFYINDDAVINIITRGRHIGMASVFVTNTPEKLPTTVFRQLDNLFLLNLTHRDDIRNVSKNSFTDEETIQSFATRMPDRHALIMGNVTARYPLVVEVNPLPDGVPPTGRTKSTWDRFRNLQPESDDQGAFEDFDFDDVPF